MLLPVFECMCLLIFWQVKHSCVLVVVIDRLKVRFLRDTRTDEWM